MRVSKNKAIAAIFTMALATGTLFGCSQSDHAASDNQSSQSQNTASETQGEPQDRTIADMRGDEVLVPAEADTVMTVNSVATQMVLMLGGEDAAATMGRGFDYSEGSLNQAMFPGLAGKPTICLLYTSRSLRTGSRTGGKQGICKRLHDASQHPDSPLQKYHFRNY